MRHTSQQIGTDNGAASYLNGFIGTPGDQPSARHVESRAEDTSFRFERTWLRNVIQILEGRPGIIVPES